MSLTVETGAGLTNAESYVSVADAASYLTSVGADLTNWDAATEAEQEAALRRATEYLDGKFAARWKGRRAHETQALNWPRIGVVVEGYWLSDSALPPKLTQACALLALAAIDGDALFTDEANAGAVKAEAFSVGSISTSTTYAGSQSQQKRYVRAEGLLVDLLHSTTMLERG